VGTAAYVLADGSYSFAASQNQASGTLGTLRNDQTGASTTVSAPPGCTGPTGLLPTGQQLIGGPWLAVDCSDAHSSVVDLYSLADGTWRAVTPASSVQQYCGQNAAMSSCLPVAVGSDWIEFDETCYHCGDTYVFQNIQTGQTTAGSFAAPPGTTSTSSTVAGPPPQPTSVLPASSSPSYGIADASSVCSSWTGSTCNGWTYGFASYYQNGITYFTQLRNNLPVTYARFFVPYDAFQSWNGSQCAASPAWNQGNPQQGGVGQTRWSILAAELQDARALSPQLQPTIAITSGTGIGGVPAYPDPTTTTGYWDYYCGVEGLMNLTSFEGVPVNQWEAWNEPDGACEYNNPPQPGAQCPNNTGTYATGADCSGTSGGDKAAQLWSAADDVEIALKRSDLLAAGTFSHPSVGYFNDYYCELGQNLGRWPSRWSFHAYNDVGSWVDGTADEGSANFDQNLYNKYHSAGVAQPYVWITEAAVDLTNHDTSFSNGSPTTGCSDGETEDANLLAGCLDQSPLQQQNAAPNFLNLGTLGAAFSGQIRQVYWYQFQPANASTGFDAALLSPPSGTYTSPNGKYGEPRQSYCVLARISASNCSSSAGDAGDWSTNPGPPS
jgi:hypothetical protein